MFKFVHSNKLFIENNILITIGEERVSWEKKGKQEIGEQDVRKRGEKGGSEKAGLGVERGVRSGKQVARFFKVLFCKQEFLPQTVPCGKLINLQCFLSLRARARVWAPPGRVHGWDRQLWSHPGGCSSSKAPDHPSTGTGASPWPSPAPQVLLCFGFPRQVELCRLGITNVKNIYIYILKQIRSYITFINFK